eukprot:3763150-Amphidinium_carterae.1
MVPGSKRKKNKMRQGKEEYNENSSNNKDNIDHRNNDNMAGVFVPIPGTDIHPWPGVVSPHVFKTGHHHGSYH